MNPNTCWQITFFWVDDDDATGKSVVYVPDGNDVAAYAQSLATLMSMASDCALRKFSLSFSVYSGVERGGGDGANQGAFFFADTAGDIWATVIPGLKDSCYIENDVTVDTTNTDIYAIIAAITNGIDGTQPNHTITGRDITTLISAYKQIRA